VNLMTVHASKGLEFPVVFMLGMEEGLFPHKESMGHNNQIEEERSVVGVTQKGDSLFVNCSFTVTSSVLRSLVASPEDARAPLRGFATSKKRVRWETNVVGNPG